MEKSSPTHSGDKDSSSVLRSHLDPNVFRWSRCLLRCFLQKQTTENGMGEEGGRVKVEDGEGMEGRNEQGVCCHGDISC